MKRKKGAIGIETVVWYLVGFAVLVLGGILIMVFLGKGEGMAEAIKNIFRFRG